MSNASQQAGYAPVNGINLYYEIHGSGQPVVLLHGGLGAIEMFGEVLPMLAAKRQVIAVDLQAHGRTADIDRPMRYEAMADDIAALIAHLSLDKPDVMGYSLGGGVALRTAIQHPDVVRKLVVVSTPFKRDGWYPEILIGQAQMGAAAAEPMKHADVPDVCQARAEAGGLAGPALKDRQLIAAAVRLVHGRGRHHGAGADRGRRC